MNVVYQKGFVKKFVKLPVKIQDKFLERLKLFQQKPFHPLLHNHSVDSAYRQCHSINITGDYRAIFRQQDNAVIFITIGTHSELY